MPRVPTKVQDLLNFSKEHAVTWTPVAAAIGISPAQLTAYKAIVGDAEMGLTTQTAAKDAAKSATLTANGRVRELRTNLAGMIRSITTFAEAQADPNVVYAAAQIDPPSPRTPSEPPGQPHDITATLDSEGGITLKWKCINPEGGNVVYSIMRRFGSSGAFEQAGVSGSRAFLDDSIPAGSATVQYQLRGYRGQKVGPASPVFLLQFGSEGGGGDGARTIEKATSQTLKVAA